MSSNTGQTLAVGVCKRCGRVIEYTPVSTIKRDVTTPCMTQGENGVREMQQAIHKNAKYCGECSSEMHKIFLGNLLSLPKRFIKR